MEEAKEKCYLCDSEVLEYNKKVRLQSNIYTYKCKNCGLYQINELAKNLNQDDKAKAACVACERRLKNQDGYYLNKSGKGNTSKLTVIKIDDFINEFPQNPINRFQRALLNLGRLYSPHPFAIVVSSKLNPNLFFVNYQIEKDNILEYMREEKIINVKATNDDTYLTPRLFSITPAGWARIAKLQEQYKEHSDKAFLAMWFDDATKKFSEAAKEGAKAAGYKLLVVSDKHHNDFIMNKVLNMIDEAKFVIADFTCIPENTSKDGVKNGIRGGVYYEAGFASGQGKEVIMTCKDDSEALKRRHFDVEQKNTIFWKEKDKKIVTSQGEFDFADYLKERIIRSVGKGPQKQ